MQNELSLLFKYYKDGVKHRYMYITVLFTQGNLTGLGLHFVCLKLHQDKLIPST